MSRVDAIGRLKPASRWLCLTGIVLAAVTILVAGLAIWEARQEAYASYRREMANLGIALAEQAARSLQAVDLVLRQTQRELLAADVAEPAEFKARLGGETVYNFIWRHSKNLPQADVIGVIDSDGALANSSRFRPTPPVDLSERDWFVYLRDHPRAGLYVSRPWVGKITGEWTFYLADRLSGPHGEFLGAVVAGIKGSYFEEFYQAISLQPGSSIAILGRDGTLIARYPRVESMLGKKLSSQSRWYEKVAAGGGSYVSPGHVDGVSRIVSVHPLRDYPLVVTVTISEQAALADWRSQSLLIAGGALALALSFGVLFGTLAARSHKLERQSAELAASAEALRRSEARFRDFALTSSDWFWETDESHRFVYQSEEIRAFGQDPRERIGRTRVDLAADAGVAPEKWQEHLAVLDRHEPFRDFVYARKIGDTPERMISVSGRPHFDAANRFVGYRGTARDVTGKFLAERRLREAKIAAEAANLAKSQFLANVSHELRTPLNAILGFSEMLELGLAGQLEPRQSEYVRLIRQSADHLHQVINDILDLAKVDAGKLDLHDEPGVCPRRTIDACLAIVHERARLGRLRLSVAIDHELPLLIADETRLKQILLNLLSNAIKFTEPGGSVVIAARQADHGGMAFEVRDTGAGMTADEIETALEPFGQVDGGLGRRHEGTGLGLPLARRLAELHGGSLWIDSVKGEGTTVIVTLPAYRVVAAAGPAPTDVGAAA